MIQSICSLVWGLHPNHCVLVRRTQMTQHPPSSPLIWIRTQPVWPRLELASVNHSAQYNKLLPVSRRRFTRIWDRKGPRRTDLLTPHTSYLRHYDAVKGQYKVQSSRCLASRSLKIRTYYANGLVYSFWHECCSGPQQ